MPIIYVLSSILVLILFVLLKKTDDKLEIIKTLVIAIVLQIAYNTAVCYIFNFVNIPITLLSLSIFNACISLIMLAIILKTKKIQKYKFSITNLIATIVIVFIAITIMNINFGNVTKIRYVSMDSREHYKAAREFSENTQLRSKIQEVTETRVDHMLVGYTNVGILFKIFEPYIGTVHLYKVYILAELAVFILTGLMFYMLIEKYLNSIRRKIIAILFCSIYILGYPLNAWITGFHYLIFGIMFFETIIYLFENIFDKKINISINIIALALCNFGLMFSYALFCPFVYLAEFAFLIYKFVKDKEKRKIITYTLCTLIIPGILGVLYIIVPLFEQMSGFITQDGWIYKNLWSNFILFIPLTIYSIYKSIKNKKISFDLILILLLLIYMAVLFIGVKINKVSIYYFYKSYYALWTMLIYFNIKGLVELLEKKSKKQILAYMYVAIYIVIFIVFGLNEKSFIEYENSDDISKTMQIFSFNKTMIEIPNAEFISRVELDLLAKLELNAKEEYNNKEKTLIITDPNEEQWLESLTGYNNKYRFNSETILQNIKEKKYKYLCVFEDKSTYKILEKHIEKDDWNLLYENEIGKVYEKKEI